jgi:hypothetical protein
MFNKLLSFELFAEHYLDVEVIYISSGA